MKKCIEKYVTLFSLEIIEIFGIKEIISSTILSCGEVRVFLVVGHRAEVVMLRLWQVVMEITTKMHREMKNVAGLVNLEIFIIIVFLWFLFFVRLSINTFGKW